VARTTLVAIEKGERRPSNVELVKLAEILGTNVHNLTREGLVRAEISPRFRYPAGKAEAPEVASAIERLRQFGARYVELERLAGLSRMRPPLENLQTFRLEPGASSGFDPQFDGETAARIVRAILGVGHEPIVDLDERLEAEAGLRIFYLDGLPSKLAAFLIWTDEIGACVGINRAHPRERQRWSLAHEFGHFLRDRELGDVLEDEDLGRQAGEIFPEAVAKEFLLPATGVQKRFSDKCRAGKFTPIDLLSLATIFGVSFQAMALRLEELQLLPKGSYEKIKHSRLRPTDLAPHEPSSVPRPDPRLCGLPERYVSLAVSAHDQELLSESEFADFLQTDIATARDIYQNRRVVAVDSDSWVSVNFDRDLRTA
jgi:Zn-dependent peptidase ImmA (M78 family)